MYIIYIIYAYIVYVIYVLCEFIYEVDYYAIWTLYIIFVLKSINLFKFYFKEEDWSLIRLYK